jgi:anti-sigma regulatory factor (Ser/Thr protein kinase)
MMTIKKQVTLSAELESLPLFRKAIDQICDQEPAIDEQTRYDLKLAADEACTNIILYGYSGMNPGSIIMTCEIDPQEARLTITDFGHPFEPVDVDLPDPKAVSHGGQDELGLFFIHQSSDRIEYESSPAGNNLVLVKFLNRNE